MKLVRKIRISFFVAFVLPLLMQMARAEVLEIDSYAKSTFALADASLVVFDIDNTLVRPKQTLGSDQWYGDLVKKYSAEGLSENQAIDHAIADWLSVQKKTEVLITEPELIDILAALKSRSIPVMALTARPKELAEATLKQLESVNIDLGSNAVSKNDYDPASNSDIHYTRGILFVGPKTSKGPALKDYLDSISAKAAKFVFYDDKKKHVDSLEQTFADNNRKYLGFRYGHLDTWVKNYDADLAAEEFKIFKANGKLVSDESLMPNPIFSLSCNGRGDITSLSIKQTGLHRYGIYYDYDLDVPGGASGSGEFTGYGKSDALSLDLKVKENGSIKGAPIAGENAWEITIKSIAGLASGDQGSSYICNKR
jgi:hypothetical protein